MPEIDEFQPRAIEIHIGRQSWACTVSVDGRPLAVTRFAISVDMQAPSANDAVHVELGLDGFFMEPLIVKGRLLVDEGDLAALPTHDELEAMVHQQTVTVNKDDQSRVYAMEM